MIMPSGFSQITISVPTVHTMSSQMKKKELQIYQNVPILTCFPGTKKWNEANTQTL